MHAPINVNMARRPTTVCTFLAYVPQAWRVKKNCIQEEEAIDHPLAEFNYHILKLTSVLIRAICTPSCPGRLGILLTPSIEIFFQCLLSLHFQLSGLPCTTHRTHTSTGSKTQRCNLTGSSMFSSSVTKISTVHKQWKSDSLLLYILVPHLPIHFTRRRHWDPRYNAQRPVA